MGEGLLMAFALSLDGFGVGLAYGLRRIRIPLISLILIALCTGIAMGLSMLFGTGLTFYLGFIPARLIGAGILLSIGLFQIIRTFKHQKETGDNLECEAVPAIARLTSEAEPRPVFCLQLRFFGLIVQVLRTPDLADMDQSGRISWRESILLGSALAIDAFAAGIGAGLAGMSFTMIAFVALIQILIIRAGQYLAGKFPEKLMDHAAYLPGLVLIMIGISKLI